MSTFAEQLKEVRKERNIKQEQLASEMNVSRQTISHWENGRAIPDIDTIKRLSQVLDHNFFVIEGVSDETESAPTDVKAPVQEETVRKTETASGKRKMLAFIVCIILLCAVVTGVFVIKGKNQNPEIEDGAYNTQQPAAQKANVVITPVMNPVPLIVVEDFPEGYGWMYEVVIEETAGVPFTVSQLMHVIIDEDGMEYPSNFAVDHVIRAWGGDTLYKDAPRNWRGGIPEQPVKAIRLIFLGTDANGNEVEAECTIELLKKTEE